MTFWHPADADLMMEAWNDPEAVGVMLDDNQRALEQYLSDSRFVVLAGTSDAGGAATIAHGIDLTQQSVLLAQAVYSSAANQITVATVSLIDATNVTVASAGNTKSVRVTLVLGRKRVF